MKNPVTIQNFGKISLKNSMNKLYKNGYIRFNLFAVAQYQYAGFIRRLAIEIFKNDKKLKKCLLFTKNLPIYIWF